MEGFAEWHCVLPVDRAGLADDRYVEAKVGQVEGNRREN